MELLKPRTKEVEFSHPSQIYLLWECLHRGDYDERSPFWAEYGELGNDFDKWYRDEEGNCRRLPGEITKQSIGKFVTYPYLVKMIMDGTQDEDTEADDFCRRYIFCAFDPSMTKHQLMNRFEALIDSERKIRNIANRAKGFLEKDESEKDKEVRLYDEEAIIKMLNVWDLKTAGCENIAIADDLGIGKIVEGRPGSEKVTTENARKSREISRLKAKADRLIKNAVRGFFPAY